MVTAILEPTEANIARAADALRRGELVAMPTETVYGLAAAVFNEGAVAAVFAAKARPAFDPLIVHVPYVRGRSGAEIVGDIGAAHLIEVQGLNPIAHARIARLAAAFWPGPLTMVLPKHAAVPDLVTSGLPTVAIRMPRHPVAQALLTKVAMPLAAPSANRFGRISPTSAADVVAELAGRVPLVLDGGPCEIGVESSVIAIADDGALTLLRPGGIGRREIERVTETSVAIDESDDDPGPSAAPGRLASHYAPAKPLRMLEQTADSLRDDDIGLVRSLVPAGAAAGLLVRRGDPKAAASAFENATGREAIARSLSLGGDLIESARNLFASLRALDGSPALVVFAEPWRDAEGLGYAIADRLRRAASEG